MSYSPSLGRWVQQDPLGYVDGSSLYQYELSRPTSDLDPSGLQASAGTAVKEGMKILDASSHAIGYEAARAAVEKDEPTGGPADQKWVANTPIDVYVWSGWWYGNKLTFNPTGMRQDGKVYVLVPYKSPTGSGWGWKEVTGD